MNWFTRLWSTAPAKTPVRVTRPVVGADTLPKPAPVVEQPADRHFLPWLPANTTPVERALSVSEYTALNTLQGLLAQPAVPDALLPRTAELVPQLIALLRETDLPLQAIAQRVGKDALLAAEVLRLASSSYYRAQKEVTDIVQAIHLIGAVGLQTAIARVVLKPIHRDTTGLIDADVAARLWEHSETLADLTAQLAEAAGHPRFDGYLIGLLHNTGWRVTLCAIERAGLTLESMPSMLFASHLAERTHRLFGLAARRWSITPGFAALADDAYNHGLTGGQHPMAPLLQHALQLCLHNQQTDSVPAPVQATSR